MTRIRVPTNAENAPGVTTRKGSEKKMTACLAHRKETRKLLFAWVPLQKKNAPVTTDIFQTENPVTHVILNGTCAKTATERHV
jgi:hypothetical protein